MLMIIVFGFLFYAGWSHYPWWTPAAALAAFSPLILFKIASVNNWRHEAGLAGFQAGDILLNLAVSLAIFFVAYACGLGARKLLRPAGYEA